MWPLKDPEEPRLIRYFVAELARWVMVSESQGMSEAMLTNLQFDLCDYERHFELVVPRRAATCPLLLHAILAVSGRHMSFRGKCDLSVFTKYHDICLQHMIEALNESCALLDENILAATVILRYLEEVDGMSDEAKRLSAAVS